MKVYLPDLKIADVHTALKHYRDSIGKVTKTYHYVNEFRLIRFAITGRTSCTKDLAPAERRHKALMRLVVFMNCEMISAGISYKLRKQVCRLIVEKSKGSSSK